MFARIPALFLLVIGVLSVFAAASVVPRTDPPINQCNTGTIQCCQTTHDSHDVHDVRLTLKLHTSTERLLESFFYSQR
jgi:hypothetical protein